ncbi:MAG: PVC-type heme-binding CxxCH protein [Planctomycetota bacterium]
MTTRTTNRAIAIIAWQLLASAMCQDAPPRLVPPSAFTAPAGLEVRVWATSPQLENPTNIDIDQRGRIWVTEGVNYRGKSQRRPEGDRVVVLQDSDGDGRADQSHVFVQDPQLISPLGIAVFDNVVVVSQPPHMLVYTDIDRDLKFDPAVDAREERLTGFQGQNHDHSLHSVTAGPDGLWYWNSGNCGAIFTDRSGKTFRITSSYMDPRDVAGSRSDDGHVYVGGFTARMQPDGRDVEIIGFNYRNSYEQVVTSFGDVFHSDNDDPPACRVTHVLEYGNAGFSSRDGQRAWRADQRPGQTVPTAQWRQEDPGVMPAGDIYGGGSPTGVAFYENGALGERWRGTLLACEPGRNTIFGYQPVRDGAGFKLDRFDWLTTNAEGEFTGSDFTGGRWDGQLHTQFRPADVAVGPDGAIYVADWFDGRVGGHQTLDDARSGTIYRVAPKGFVAQVPQVDLATVDGQIAALSSPAVNVRHLGFRRLRAGDDAARQAVATLLTHEDPHVAARAIWLMAQWDGEPGDIGAKAMAKIAMAANTSTGLAAFRALQRADRVDRSLATACAAAPSPALRAAVATAMRNRRATEWVIDVLARIGKRFDGKDRSYLEAFGIGCTGKEAAVYRRLFADAGDPVQWPTAMAWLAWRLGAPESVPALVARARSADLPEDERRRALTAIAFVRAANAMNAMLELAEDATFDLADDALWWCLSRMSNEWLAFGLRDQLAQRGIYDPSTVVVQAVAVPQASTRQPGPAVADVLAKTGVAARGAARVATCYTCHQIGDRGISFGPDLTNFAKTQSRATVIESILQPSKSIPHGFEGHTVETADGDVQGIVLARGDPVIVQSQGGLMQLIPRRKVKKIRRMKRSLMWPFELYGLDAQALADVVAFLASDLPGR